MLGRKWPVTNIVPLTQLIWSFRRYQTKFRQSKNWGLHFCFPKFLCNGTSQKSALREAPPINAPERSEALFCNVLLPRDSRTLQNVPRRPRYAKHPWISNVKMRYSARFRMLKWNIRPQLKCQYKISNGKNVIFGHNANDKIGFRTSKCEIRPEFESQIGFWMSNAIHYVNTCVSMKSLHSTTINATFCIITGSSPSNHMLWGDSNWSPQHMILLRNYHFYRFNTNPKFRP